MKDFVKYMLATVAGLFVFGIIVTALSVMSLVGMVASTESTTVVDDNSVLVINLSGIIDEQSQDNLVGELIGSTVGSSGLNDMLNAIRKAKDNDRIKGIYIQAGALDTGYATMEELRQALADFKKSKKWIVAYADTYTQSAYYVASVADKVYLNPKGMLDLHGLGSQPMFYKDLFAKFGVHYQVVKVGTYKSFTESYTEDRMTEANREQVTAYLGGLWGNICKAIAQDRKVSVDSLNAYADRLIIFEPAENLVRYKLVDGLLYADQVKAEVKKRLGLDDDDTICQLSVSDMQSVKDAPQKGDEIAVYYAYGSIVQMETGSQLSGSHSIVMSDVCRDLEDLMNDDDVKAVVVRINSGGGDAYASEQLWRQMSLLKAKKPVVVSMGDYAASGAYYMSCPASWIVAEPNTLTGSIGIFGVIPDLSELVTQKLGVKFDEVKTNRNSTFGNVMARPLNSEEQTYLQAYINRGYTLFRQRVADGRHKSVDEIEKIAQGRVWIASDALRIGLVDQLGTLDAAIAKAAQLAKTDKYYTTEYPAPQSWVDQLLDFSAGDSYLDTKLRTTLGDLYEPYSLLLNLNHREAMQARVPFILQTK